MASRRSEEFRHEAVRLALTSGLTRTRIAATPADHQGVSIAVDVVTR